MPTGDEFAVLLAVSDRFQEVLDATTVPFHRGGRRVDGIAHAVALSEATQALSTAMAVAHARLHEEHGRPSNPKDAGITFVTSDSPTGPWEPIPPENVKGSVIGIGGGGGADALLLSALDAAMRVIALPPHRQHRTQRWENADWLTPEDLARLEAVPKLLRLSARTTPEPTEPDSALRLFRDIRRGVGPPTNPIDALRMALMEARAVVEDLAMTEGRPSVALLEEAIAIVEGAQDAAEGIGAHLTYGLAQPGVFETTVRGHLRRGWETLVDVRQASEACDPLVMYELRTALQESITTLTTVATEPSGLEPRSQATASRGRKPRPSARVKARTEAQVSEARTEAVRLARARGNIRQAARELSMPHSTLHEWVEAEGGLHPSGIPYRSDDPGTDERSD